MSLFSRSRVFSAVLAAATFWMVSSPGQAAEPVSGSTMTIQPSTTSVPLGKAALTVGTLNRRNGAFAGSYNVKVSPISFASEQGDLFVNFSDEDVRKLTGKSAVTFQGQATNSGGKHRTVSGQASPTTTEGGNITIKINSEKGKLVFRTTYRLSGK